MPGNEIFKYLDENDKIVNVNSSDLNAYIHEVMGDEFSAKDFRTWGGTMVAAIALDEIGMCEEKDQKELDKKNKRRNYKSIRKIRKYSCRCEKFLYRPSSYRSLFRGKNNEIFSAGNR